MSIKISNFVPLNTPAGNDILPIIDVSEPNTADQNKKITVDNLLSLATGQENPYIKVTYTEDILPTTPNGNLIIGESFNKYSDLPYTNRIPDGYNIVLGRFNSINAPNNDTEVYGEFTSPFVRIFGNDNNIGQNCREASIIGYASVIAYNAWGSLILGTNSVIGNLFNTADPLAVNDYSIAIGDSVNIQGNNCTAIGHVSKIYNKSANSIAIGTGARIGDTTATTPTDGAVAIGENSRVTNNYGIALGISARCAAEYGTAVGNYSEIQEGAEDAIALGSCYIPSTGVNAIAIGLNANANGPQSIAIGRGATSNSTTGFGIAIGNNAGARAVNSIVIGNQSGIFNNCLNTLAFGNNINSIASSTNNILLGNNTLISANNVNYNILLGQDTSINTNLCENSILIGKNASITGTNTANSNNIIIGTSANIHSSFSPPSHTNNIILGNNAKLDSLGFNSITNSIQLGTGTVSTSNTLQFGSTKLANSDLGIAIKANTIAPAVTTQDVGTLGLNAGTPQYVNSGGTWTNLTTKFAPYSLSRSAGAGNQTLSINGTTTLLHDTFGQLTAAGYINAPITYTSASGAITFSQIGVYRIFGSFTVASATASQAFFININTVSGTVNYNSNNFYTTSATANALSYINAEFLISVTTLGAQIQLQALTSGNASTITLYPQSSSLYTTNKFSITMI